MNSFQANALEIVVSGEAGLAFGSASFLVVCARLLGLFAGHADHLLVESGHCAPPSRQIRSAAVADLLAGEIIAFARWIEGAFGFGIFHCFSCKTLVLLIILLH